MRPLTRFNFINLLFILLFVSLVSLTGYKIAKRNLLSARYLWGSSASHHTSYWTSSPIRPAPLPALHPNLSLWLARDALQMGDSAQALLLLEPLIRFDNPKVYALYGEALEAEGEFKAAVSIWREAKDVRSLRGAAWRATKEERYEEGLLAYQAAYRIEPEASAKPLAHLLWFFLEQEEQAEALLRQTLTTYPDSPHRLEWWHELGWLYRKQERWDAAEEVYQQILALEASDWRSHIHLGWLYYERDHDVEKAQAHFQRAIALDPTPAEGYFALAQLLNREGAYSQADQWYQQALERSPKTYYWYILRANNAQSAGDMSLALAIYEELISRFPDSPQAYMRAAELYEASNQIERAIEAYQQLLELEPNHEAAKQGIERLTKNTDSSD